MMTLADLFCAMRTYAQTNGVSGANKRGAAFLRLAPPPHIFIH